MKVFRKITIILFLFCSSFSLANNLEQINQERKNNHQSFLNSLNHIQACSEKANNLSNRITLLDQSISNQKEFYNSIRTEDDFQKGLGFRKKNQKDIKDIKGHVRVLKRKCSLFTSVPIINQLELSIQALKDNLQSMNYDQEWIETTKKIDQNLHIKYKLGDCIADLQAPSLRVISWSYDIDLAYDTGDIFMVNQGISTLKVLNDYITGVVSACDIEGTMQAMAKKNMSSTTKEFNQKIITGMQKDVQNSQSRLKKATEKYSLLNFAESSTKICKKLNEFNKDQVGLCENPLNNPSWHYSVSYFLNKE